MDAEKFTLPGFIEWLKTKDPKEHYSWWSSDHCLLVQWAEHVYPAREDRIWYANLPFVGQNPPTVFVKVASEPPYIYGAALERAESYALRITKDDGSAEVHVSG